MYYGEDKVVLTPVEELSFETTHVCHQFIAHRLRECEKDIAKDRRWAFVVAFVYHLNNSRFA